MTHWYCKRIWIREVYAMQYQLPNGTVVELSKIRSISRLRDLGECDQSIATCWMGFSILLSGREVIEVKDTYHYSDWAEVKLRLNGIRKEIMQRWQQEAEASS